jgi:hypothetical protein
VGLNEAEAIAATALERRSSRFVNMLGSTMHERISEI